MQKRFKRRDRIRIGKELMFLLPHYNSPYEPPNDRHAPAQIAAADEVGYGEVGFAVAIRC